MIIQKIKKKMKMKIRKIQKITAKNNIKQKGRKKAEIITNKKIVKEKKEKKEEEHFDEEESQNDVHTDEQNEAHYNIEEYLPYEHKHDQYSCSCCEHYYTDCIKNNTDLPEARCEVCGNEINQRSLNFYKNKNRNSNIKAKK